MTLALDRPPVYHLPGECMAGIPWCVHHDEDAAGTVIHEADVTGLVVADQEPRRHASAGTWVSQATAEPTVNLGVRLGADGTLRQLRFSPAAARSLSRALAEAANIATDSCPAGQLEVGDCLTIGGRVQMVVALLHDLWCCEDDDCPGKVQIFTDVSEAANPDTPALHVRIDDMVQLGSVNDAKYVAVNRSAMQISQPRAGAA